MNFIANDFSYQVVDDYDHFVTCVKNNSHFQDVFPSMFARAHGILKETTTLQESFPYLKNLQFQQNALFCFAK